MKRERATRGKVRNRILSLFLTLCMVAGLLPQGIVPVKAETADATYYVGGTKLDMSSTDPQYSGENKEWIWDSADKVLTFRKNFNCDKISLPADTTIIILGGIKVLANGGTADTATVSCDGKLQIIGGGGLWLYNNSTGGNVLECGELKIGTDDANSPYEAKRPFVYCACDAAKSGANIKVTWSDADYAIDIIRGQLSMASTSSKIVVEAGDSGRTGKSVRLRNHAVLYCINPEAITADSVEYKGREGDSAIYYATNDQYHTVDYLANGYVAKYENGDYSLTEERKAGIGAATKENIRLCETDIVNLYVTIGAPNGYYLVGWCQENGDKIYYKEDEITYASLGASGDVLKLYPVFASALEIGRMEIDRKESKLIFSNTHLQDSMYVVTFVVNQKDYKVTYAVEEGKYTATYTVNGEEKTVTYDDVIAGEGFEVNLTRISTLTGTECSPSDIESISAVEIQWIGSGYEEQTVSTEKKLEGLNVKETTPTEKADFTIAQAEKKDGVVKSATITKKDASGLTAEYQYRVGDAGEWISGNDNPAEIPVGKENVTVYIRRAPTSDKWESAAIPVTLNGVKEEAPTDAKYNYAEEKITDLDPNKEYTITIGNQSETKTAGADGTIEVTVPDGTTEITVVKKGGEDAGDSPEHTITLKTSSEVAKPDPADFKPVDKGDKKVIEEIGEDYEYRKKTGDGDWSEWTPGRVTDLEVGDDDLIEIRKKATAEAPASDSIRVTKGLKIDIDYQTETLIGFEAGESYEITVGTEKTSVTPAGDSIVIDESYFGKTVSVVKKGKDGEPDSDPYEVIVPSRPAATIDFGDLDIKLVEGTERLEQQYTIPDGYQYRKGETGTWTDGPATVTITAGETLNIRKKAAADTFASEGVGYQGEAKEFTPAATADYSAGKLTDLAANAQYEITVDGNKYEVTADEAGKADLEDSYYGKTISIVKKGVTLENGATTEDSAAQSLTINEKAQPPQEGELTPELDGDYMLIKNVPDDYEYSDDGGETWKDPVEDAEHPDWGKYIRVPAGTKVLIRRKATANEAPSNPITVTTQEAAPNAKADYTTGKLTDLSANAQYEITVDGKKNTVTADAAGKIDLEPYYGKTISIVKKGNGTSTTDSEAQSLTIKAKTPAPNKDNFTTQTDGNKTTIKNVPNDCEYSTDGGNTWNPGGKDIVVDNGTEVLIRKKGTENDPPSESVTIKAEAKSTPEAMPAAKVDYTAGKLTNLVANAQYEITVDGKKNIVTADASGKIELDSYCGKTISIVKKGNGTTTTDSQAQSLTITAKTSTPSENKFETQVNDDGNVVIKNITSDMEYSVDDGKTWKTGTGKDLVVSVGTKVLIRIKATATTPASTPIVINTVTKVSTIEAIAKTITGTNTDKNIDVPGSTFSKIRLKATGKSTSIKLTWKKVSGATGYIIYGSKCGTKMKKITTIKGASKKTYTQKKLKAGKFYKYIVVAYKDVDGKQVALATSKSAHAMTTKNSKYSNPKSVKVNASKVTLKKGKSKTIKASYVMPKNKKQKVHIKKFRYESSNPAVATVSSKGKIKAKKKGKATIYVIAQNGVNKTIKVTVK